jgi:C4-dicarboxylate transporter DctQ subunit
MRTIGRAYDRLLDIMGLTVATIVLAAMVAVAFDVCSRYFFDRPIAWVFELTEYGLLYIPCLGMAWLAREGGHVAVDSFVARTPSTIQRALFLLTTGACAAVCYVIAYWGTIVVVGRYQQGTVVDQMIRTPEFLLLWVIPFGFALTAIEFTRLLAQRALQQAAT